MSKRSKRGQIAKPKKPYPSFPLGAHSSGAWVKRIGGRLFYFGRWASRADGVLERLPDDNWKEALAIYESQKADLYAGRVPVVAKKPGDQTQPAGLILKDLANQFLTD